MENIFNSKELGNLIMNQAKSLQNATKSAYQEGYKKGFIEGSLQVKSQLMAESQVRVIENGIKKVNMKTFEQFLQDKFMQDFHGVKDQYESAYESWVENLDTQEVIDFAEEAIAKTSITAKEEIMSKLEPSIRGLQIDLDTLSKIQ